MKKLAFSPKKILVVKAAGIGDLLLAVPALRALRRGFPGARTDLLVTPKCATLLKNCPYVDDIYVIETHGMKNEIRPADGWRIVRTLYGLRKRKYDLLVNLYHLFSDRGAARMKLMCRAIGAGLTVGRNTDGRGAFLDASIPDSWTVPDFRDRHEVELNLDVVGLLGVEDSGQGLEFWVREEERLRVKQILAQKDISERQGAWIVLNPGGDAVYKRWPEESFAALGDLLAEKLSAKIFVVGGREDRPVTGRVVSRMKTRAVDLTGGMGLAELAAFLEQCDLMVTNDTGPMHLAAAVGIPVVALFGPGNPGRYGPFGPVGFHAVIQHPVECGPCTDFECEDRACLKQIHPDEVFRKVSERLGVHTEACL